MDSGPTRRDWAIVATLTFIAGFAIAGLLLGNANAGAVPARSDWPAWVQALGSVAALGVAIWVPARQRRKDREAKHGDELVQARIIAGAIQPFIPAYRRRATYLLHLLTEKRPVRELKFVPEEAFDIPKTIEQFHPSFHLLGDSAELANRFVASLFWLQQGVKAIHHDQVDAETRRQIEIDCQNTINFALKLSPMLESMGGRIERRHGAERAV